MSIERVVNSLQNHIVDYSPEQEGKEFSKKDLLKETYKTMQKIIDHFSERTEGTTGYLNTYDANRLNLETLAENSSELLDYLTEHREIGLKDIPSPLNVQKFIDFISDVPLIENCDNSEFDKQHMRSCFILAILKLCQFPHLIDPETVNNILSSSNISLPEQDTDEGKKLMLKAQESLKSLTHTEILDIASSVSPKEVSNAIQDFDNLPPDRSSTDRSSTD